MERAQVESEPINIDLNPEKEPEQPDLQSAGTSSNDAIHDRSKHFRCDECSCGFSKPDMLAWHSRNCHGIDPAVKVLQNLTYQCSACQFEHTRTESMIQHLRAHHGFSDLPFECDICGKSFIVRAHLNKHRNACTNMRIVSGTIIRNLKCEECDMKFAHQEMLTWHVENFHGSEAIVKVVNNGEKRSFQCVLCDVSYEHLYCTIGHLRSKHNLSKLPFHCVMCDVQFVTLQALTKHQSICKTEKIIRNLKCDICDMRFGHREMLLWHEKHCHGTNAIVNMVTVGKKRTFQCGICKTVQYGKLCRTISHLRNKHKLTKLPFTCKTCGKQFIDSFNLQKHESSCKKNTTHVTTRSAHVENSQTGNVVPFEEVYIKMEPEDEQVEET